MFEVAQRAVDAGVDAVFIHARTGESKHGMPVDLEPVAKVKEILPVPVLVNGSMDTAEAIRQAKDVARVDGYQIGRAACGDPWLFRNLIAELRGEPLHNPSLEERRALLEQHFNLIIDLFGEKRGVRHAQIHLLLLPGSAWGALSVIVLCAFNRVKISPRLLRSSLSAFQNSAPSIVHPIVP